MSVYPLCTHRRVFGVTEKLGTKNLKSEEFLNVSAIIGLGAALLICTLTPPSVCQLWIAPYILLFIVFASPRIVPHSHGHPKVSKASKLFVFSHPMMGDKKVAVARSSGSLWMPLGKYK
jgi:hypothetical protein